MEESLMPLWDCPVKGSKSRNVMPARTDFLRVFKAPIYKVFKAAKLLNNLGALTRVDFNRIDSCNILINR
jgi:hypothetical protein